MELNNQTIHRIFNKFDHQSDFKACKELTSGHINDTFFIESTSSRDFVLQRINSFVFKKAKELILNKDLVSNHIQKKLAHLPSEELYKRVLLFVNAKSGKPYFKDEDGNYWNMTIFIDGSKTFERVTNEEIAFEGGKLYGEFLNLANGINTNDIVDIIPNFHEMSFRYEQFYESLENANSERLNLASESIQQVKDLKEEMHILENLKNSGQIPLSITHNDTKISNALFDDQNKGLCVIDTDTVMVGIIHYDFGDAIRTICNSAYEDEKDLTKVKFNIGFYQAFTKGFLKSYHSKLSELDVQHFALAAKTITFIMGLRMLTDFLNNDVYYKTKYDLHNLVRAKNQFKLVDEITKHFIEMNRIAIDSYKKYESI